MKKVTLTKVLMISMLLANLCTNNEAEMHYIGVPQPPIEDIIQGLNPNELAVFNEELGIQPREVLNIIRDDDIENNNEVPTNSVQYDALILFIIGTAAIFIGYIIYRKLNGETATRKMYSLRKIMIDAT